MNERIMAFVRLLVPLIVYIATAAGIALDTETVYCVLLIVAGFGATIWCWWKNNNVTSAAQTAQLYLDALKASYSDNERIAEILAEFDAELEN